MKNFITLTSILIILNISSESFANNHKASSLCHETLRDTILIINSFDAMSVKARNNKKDLFRELTDSLTNYLQDEIRKQTEYQPLVIPGILFKSSALDSIVFSLLKEHHAGKAILIWSLDTHFTESGSKGETGDDGKIHTVTSYDICVNNEYTLYGEDQILKQSSIENCEFFTTRTVKGTFGLGLGPDIVGKRKHTYKPVAFNANKYILDILSLLQNK